MHLPLHLFDIINSTCNISILFIIFDRQKATIKMDWRVRVLSLLLVAAESMKTIAFECDPSASVCETSLDIAAAMTMFHPTEKALYTHKGQLYRYDVTNVSLATPIAEDDVITVDGWEKQRVLVVANGELPGPPIIVYEGQTLVVHVTNSLYSDTVSIHWHGLPQRGSPYMDGVGFVTQCPILPGQTFTYTFKAEPSGTYWYHSHVGAQRAKGLYGALVIKERPAGNSSQDMDEFIMQVQGWNHDYDVDAAFLYSDIGVFLDRKEILPSKALDGSEFSLWYAQSGLINGKGRYYDPTTGQHNDAPLHQYNVQQGKSYRFRVINAGAMYPYRISVDNHDMIVIESDGHKIIPIVVESFIIHPGERYDFILHANKATGNYWVRGQTLEVNRRTLAEAILHYQGAAIENPTTKRRNCTANRMCLVLNCPFSFYPMEKHIQCMTFDQFVQSSDSDPAPVATPGKLKEYFLNFGFPGPDFEPDAINGIAFLFPTVSGISQPREIDQQCSKADCGEEKICFCTNSLDLNHNDTVQFVITNMGRGRGWSHPVHMHGHTFYVLKMGYGNYNYSTGKLISQNSDIDCGGGKPQDQSMCNKPRWANASWSDGNVPGINLKNPPRKDTLIVPSGGYAVVRIRADNPGLWIMHCHIQLHSADGMSLVLNESFANLPKVPDGFPTCSGFKRTSPGKCF